VILGCSAYYCVSALRTRKVVFTVENILSLCVNFILLSNQNLRVPPASKASNLGHICPTHAQGGDFIGSEFCWSIQFHLENAVKWSLSYNLFVDFHFIRVCSHFVALLGFRKKILFYLSQKYSTRVCVFDSEILKALNSEQTVKPHSRTIRFYLILQHIHNHIESYVGVRKSRQGSTGKPSQCRNRKAQNFLPSFTCQSDFNEIVEWHGMKYNSSLLTRLHLLSRTTLTFCM